MAQAGFLPIQTYYSTTASATPSASNLANGELAVNITDGILYYKDNTGNVQVIASKASAGTVFPANYVPYGNGTSALQTSANLQFSGTALTVVGTSYLGAAAGAESLRVTPVASAVNYLQAAGAVTTSSPSITAAGSDTNIGLTYTSKGTGTQLFNVGANSVLRLDNSTGNTLQLYSGGSSYNLNFIGSDTNISTTYQAKGSGFHGFATGGGYQFLITNTASAVNYLTVTGSATGNSTSLAALGSDTNISITLTPKGTGKTAFTGTGYSPNFTLTDAATIAWDTTTAGGQVATFTFVSSNRTMGAPTGLVNGAFYALAVIQNAGSNTLTWNSVFKWASGTAPTLSTAAGAKDFFTFRSDGTNLYQQGISQAVA
jgi:hypothetical protein